MVSVPPTFGNFHTDAIIETLNVNLIKGTILPVIADNIESRELEMATQVRVTTKHAHHPEVAQS